MTDWDPKLTIGYTITVQWMERITQNSNQFVVPIRSFLVSTYQVRGLGQPYIQTIQIDKNFKIFVR